jgi:hypothetical protein
MPSHISCSLINRQQDTLFKELRQAMLSTDWETRRAPQIFLRLEA